MWLFDVNAKGEKRLKNMQSERVVPVHSRLLRLGLLDYHASIQHERLWPRLTKRRDGYGAAVSKWFSRFKASCGVQDSQVFHSLRHSFGDALKQAGVADVTISELLGHENPSISTSRYGNPLNVKSLRDAVENVHYDVDLK